MEKRYFISADIEGITDVTFWSETETGQAGYDAACEQMTRETAAACRAVLAAGGLPVVRDGHGGACNIRHMDLPEGTELMRGWACHPGSMMAGLDSTFSGVIYIGYHAPAGSDGSPLAHTSEYEKIRWAKVNGKLASEFTMNSLYAASLGVPSLFLSGDEAICRMAEEELPGLATVAVKRCKGNSTWNIHPKTAEKAIEETVARQLAAGAPPVPKVPETLVLDLCLPTHQAVRSARQLPGVELVSSEVVRYTAKTVKELKIACELITG